MKLLAFPVLALALAACGGAKKPAAVVGEHASAGGLPLGHYGCRITQGGYAYDYYACDVREEGGALVIEKIEGQMRFKARIEPEGDASLAFDGEVWCTWDEGCKGTVTGNLPETEGGWEGTLPEYKMASGEMMPPMTIAIVHESVLSSAGGARYGGYGDGGWKGGGFTGEIIGE